MMMRRISAIIKNQSGAAASEMALVIPLLLVMMFGPFELANYFWTEHKAVKGVRDGARYAARLSFENYTCDTAMGDADLETQIKNLTRTGQIIGGSPNIPEWNDADVTVTITCPDAALDGSGDSTVTTGIYRGMDNAPIVRVSTTVTYQSLFQTLGFDAINLSVSASSQAAVMGI
jgi:Flp pilus assembly protein TadG